VTPSAANTVFLPDSRLLNVGPDALDINFDAYQLYSLTSEPTTNGWLKFAFAGVSGQTHELQSSSNLVNWVSLSTNIIPSNGILEFSISNNPAFSSRFLRTVLH
jgi:hypothetical protein